MAEPVSDDAYLTYDEYIKFKDKFSRNEKFSSDTITFEQLLDYANIENPKRSHLLNAFSELLRHINDDHYFSYYQGESVGACKYIRHMLQNEVEVNLTQSYSDNVNIFKNFLIKYGEKITNRKDRCISKIDPIENTTFNKMNALHRLYDEYRKYSRYVKSNMSRSCKEFDSFVKEYNIYINDNVSKSKLFNRILTNISEKVEKTASDFREQCKIENYRYDLSSPKLFTQTPVKKIEIDAPIQEGQTDLSYANAKSQSSLHEAADTSHAQLQQEVTEPPSIPKETIIDETHGEYDNDRETAINHGVYNHRREIDVKTETSSRFEPPHGGFDFLRRQSYEVRKENLQRQELLNEPARESSTILSSITGFMSEVEPAPILGVSGGMGALFLLFKYTPVGTFFRGRRGRTYGIPSGFSGTFSGEFPGYQDYYGGNIGYGQMSHLAE